MCVYAYTRAVCEYGYAYVCTTYVLTYRYEGREGESNSQVVTVLIKQGYDSKPLSSQTWVPIWLF